ncbi:MAG: hypothetical protein ACYSU7_07085 [Planctomycetota bacterium]|jgi:hypothetical protein
MCQCGCCVRSEPRKKGFRPIAFLLNMVLVWLLLVVSGGTLINTGHPVAVEAGRLLHVVTFVDPAIIWADTQGVAPVSHGLRLLSHGIPVGSIG